MFDEILIFSAMSCSVNQDECCVSKRFSRLIDSRFKNKPRSNDDFVTRIVKSGDRGQVVARLSACWIDVAGVNGSHIRLIVHDPFPDSLIERLVVYGSSIRYHANFCQFAAMII